MFTEKALRGPIQPDKYSAQLPFNLILSIFYPDILKSSHRSPSIRAFLELISLQNQVEEVPL